MNDLIKESYFTRDKITSLELLNQINIFRKEEDSKLTTHRDLMIIIETEFSNVNRKRVEGGMCPETHTLIINELLQEGIERSSYINEQNKQEYPMYILPINKAKQCLLKESKFVRKAVIAYIDKLESALKQTFKVPTTLKEALLLAAEQLDVIEKQQTLLLEQAPKVEFYDDVVDSKDAIDMAQVAKVLNMGIGRNKLFQLLRDNNILDRKNQPYQSYVQAGYFRCVESSYMKPNGDTCVNIKTVVFQKGLNYISKLIKNSKEND